MSVNHKPSTERRLSYHTDASGSSSGSGSFGPHDLSIDRIRRQSSHSTGSGSLGSRDPTYGRYRRKSTHSSGSGSLGSRESSFRRLRKGSNQSSLSSHSRYSFSSSTGSIRSISSVGFDHVEGVQNGGKPRKGKKNKRGKTYQEKVSGVEGSCWYFHTKMFFLFTRIFRITKWMYEDQQKALLIILSNSVVMTFAMIGFVFLVAMGLEDVIRDAADGVYNHEITTFLVVLLVAVVLAMNLFQFMIFRKIQVLVFVMNTALAAAINFLHFWCSREIGIYDGSPIIAMLITVFAAYSYGGTIQLTFWGLFFIFDVTIALIHNILFATQARVVEFYLDKDQVYVMGNTLCVYFAYSCVFAVTFIVFFLEKLRKKKKDIIIKRIGECILTLDFDGKYFKLFEKRDVRFCNRIERLFKNIIYNLKTYKSYLPDVIRNGGKIDSTNEEDQPVPEGSGSNGTNNSTPSLNSTNSGSQGGVGKAIGKRVVDYSLRTKSDVVVLVFKVFDIYRWFHSLNLKVVRAFCSSFVDIVSSEIHKNRGVVNEISTDGSEILCSLNASKLSTSSYAKAVRIACYVKNLLQNSFLDIKLGVCVVENVESFVGNLKATNYSKFMIFGRHSEIIQKMKMMQRGRYSILVNTPIFKKCKYQYEFKQVDYDERLDTGIFQVEKQLISPEKTNEEWMYQLGNRMEKGSNTSNGFRFSKIWSEYMEGNFEAAARLVSEYKNDNPMDRDVALLLKKLKLKVDSSALHQ